MESRVIRALLLALALAGCEGQVHVESAPIAQADPTTEADWPGIYGYRRQHHVFQRKDKFPVGNLATPLPDSIAGYPYPKDSLTVTNATAHTLLIEQEHVATLVRPDSTYCVELGGPVTITEASEYDE